MEKLYSVKELASYLGVHEVTIRNWASQNKIESTKIGKEIRFTQSSIERFLEQRKRGA